MPSMSLTLGPILFNWPAVDWLNFYCRIADEAPVDRICVGEIVCSKRWPFLESCIPGIIERLSRAGKTVVLSLPIMPTLERERRHVDEILNIPNVLIEANDVSPLARLSERPHIIGPFINTYNESTSRFFAENGATIICLPPELPLTSIRALSASVDTLFEVWGWGRVPLAISARCYHARLHHRSKASCHFVCGDDPDGRSVEDLDGHAFLAINGVQVLSHSCCNVIDDIDSLSAAGVHSLRISPHRCDMVRVVKLFRDVIDKRIKAQDANRYLQELMPSTTFSNGFLYGHPGWQMVGAKSEFHASVAASR